MNKLKLANFILLGVIFVLGGIVLYYSIFRPAYLSYAGACLEDGAEILNQSGVVWSGGYYYNSETGEEGIFVDPVYGDDNTLKHELIHKRQRLDGRSYGCDYAFWYWANEVEAYWGENYPEWLFSWVYG